MIENQEINSYLRGVVDSKSYHISLKIQNILTFYSHISHPHLTDIYIIKPLFCFRTKAMCPYLPCLVVWCVDLKSVLRGTVIKTSGSELSLIPMRDSGNKSHQGPY